MTAIEEKVLWDLVFYKLFYIKGPPTYNSFKYRENT
jgi:hypothetical protein